MTILQANWDKQYRADIEKALKGAGIKYRDLFTRMSPPNSAPLAPVRDYSWHFVLQEDGHMYAGVVRMRGYPPDHMLIVEDILDELTGRRASGWNQFRLRLWMGWTVLTGGI